MSTYLTLCRVAQARDPDMSMLPSLPLSAIIVSIISLAWSDGLTEVGDTEMGWLCVQGWIVLPFSFAALTIGKFTTRM